MAPQKKVGATAGEDSQAAASAGPDTTAGSTGPDTAAGSTGEDVVIRGNTIVGGQGQDTLFNGADPQRFDHDGDGAPGGSKPKVEAPAAPSLTMEMINAAIAEGVKAGLAARAEEEAAAKAEAEAAAAEAEAQAAGELEAAAPGAVVKRGAAPAPSAYSGPLCVVRITKTGHGQVHTGATEGKRTYDWQDEVALPRDIGEALEERSYGEILD